MCRECSPHAGSLRIGKREASRIPTCRECRSNAGSLHITDKNGKMWRRTALSDRATHRIEVPDRPEWGPLLRLVGSSLCAQFMAMGQVRQGATTKSSESTTIFLYKHIRTRRYLNLAWHGQAYRYTREGAYTPVTLGEAILWVWAE